MELDSAQNSMVYYWGGSLVGDKIAQGDNAERVAYLCSQLTGIDVSQYI